MRISFVNTIPLWGGGEHWTLQAALELRRRGHETAVVAAEGQRLLEEARSAGLPATAWPSGWWRRRKAIEGLRKDMASSRPDLLVANSGKDVRLANRLRGDPEDIPLIFRRGLDRPISNHILHRRALRKVQVLLANSAATRQTMEHSLPWFPRERIRVIHNPIDVPAFLDFERRDLRAELGIAPGAFVVGVVARLSRQKGHAVLLESVHDLVPSVPSLRLIIVGDGELREEIVRLVRSLELEAHVTFVGYQRDVRPYYEACDVIAVPSFYEGFCFAAVEAQLLGRPVVASATSSLPEVIRDGSTGILVPPGDARALTAAMATLERDPELRRRLGEEGRRWAREQFDAPRIFDEIEMLFSSLVGRREPHRGRSPGS